MAERSSRFKCTLHHVFPDSSANRNFALRIRATSVSDRARAFDKTPIRTMPTAGM